MTRQRFARDRRRRTEREWAQAGRREVVKRPQMVGVFEVRASRHRSRPKQPRGRPGARGAADDLLDSQPSTAP